jgi:hypothetical protein
MVRLATIATLAVNRAGNLLAGIAGPQAYLR